MYPATWVLVNFWIPEIVNFSTKSIHHWFSSSYNIAILRKGNRKSAWPQVSIFYISDVINEWRLLNILNDTSDNSPHKPHTPDQLEPDSEAREHKCLQIPLSFRKNSNASISGYEQKENVQQQSLWSPVDCENHTLKTWSPRISEKHCVNIIHQRRSKERKLSLEIHL